MSNKKLLLCVSATSGVGTALKLGPKVASVLSNAGWDLTVKLTNLGDDLTEIAKKNDHEYIAALGGDGYIRSIAEGVIATNKVLMPLPAGRGNDFCRKLGVGVDVLAHLENAKNFSVENVDVALATDRYNRKKIVLGIVSLGIDSFANQNANSNRYFKGMLVYVWGFVKALATFRPIDYDLIIDGEKVVTKSWTVSISSTGFYGGGIQVVPTSDIRDGVLEVITLKKCSIFSLLKLFPKIIKGTHLSDEKVNLWQCKEVILQSNTKIIPYSDGDPCGVLPLSVKVLGKALKVIH